MNKIKEFVEQSLNIKLIELNEDVHILRYKIGDEFSLHVDHESNHPNPRVYTFGILLNDDFDGGHLTFPRQNFSSEETKVGEALIFPGTVTHPHYVSQLFSGERFTLVGFSHPPAWTFSGIKINDIQ